MKLNCDLGESFGCWKMGIDEAVMPYIDMANVACGFHAGDANVMHQTLLLAKQHNVEIGAHPSYKDLDGFGRRSIPHSEQEIINLMIYQVSALMGMATSLGMSLSYVKPHGALYNDMMAKPAVRVAVFKAMQQINLALSEPLKLMMLATSFANEHRQNAKTFDIELLFEAFADRRYTDDGYLQSRAIEGSVLNTEQLLKQVKTLHQQGYVETETGNRLDIEADTICVHGDNEHSIKLIEQIKGLCG